LLIAGIVDPVRRAIQVRGRRTYCIDLHHIETGSGGMILETVRDISVDHELQERESAGAILPMLLKKLTGLLSIGRRLMGSAEFEDKMEAVLKELVASLGENSAAAWVEVDGVTYGASADSTQGLTSVQEIRVEGRPRGKLSVHWTQREDIRPEEKYFLEEAADLVGRQVEISDLWAKLRLSEERYRKLAGNLAKEMWSRTEALMKETGYLEGILRCSQDMIITTDLDSRIVEFNPGAEKMLGFTAEELQGRSISEIWVNGEERDSLMEEVILSGGIRNYETLLRTKTGETKEISLSLSLLKDEEGRILGTVGVSKEVGQENAIRRELERLNQNFREAIHFINHETKNSLIVMGGFLRRLLNSEADPSRKDQLKIVYHHSKFLEAMSRDFLVMAELEHGEFQIRKTLIRNFYKEVILPAMIGLKERYPDSFQSYDSSMGGVGDITLPGDPALLETVYRNLFGNALKYRYPDRKIAYGVTEYPDRYVFNVWNEGPGVPADETDKIFRKFYRVHDEHTKGKRGTGLGLYNIKRIIEAHGGRIWCETRPGVWINFLFELPKS
jgi:PAS domain S-box-containing protein